MANYGPKNAPFGLAGCDASGLISLSVLPTGINANLLADGSVSNTEFQYLDGATANIQTQINNIVNGGTAFEAVACATANINISNPGTAIFDTVTLNNGDTLFLLPTASGGAQTNPAQGGLYTFNGSSSALTRLSTMSTWAEVVGSIVYVNFGGPTYGSTIWRNVNSAGGTINVTSIVYAQNQNNYVGGTGVSIVGNVISIGQSVAVAATPTFASTSLTSNTNFLLIGTAGNTIQLTAPVLTAARTFTLPDANSVSIVAASAPSLNFLSGVNSNGTIAYGQPTLAGLSEIVLTSPATGDGLIYNGSNWINDPVINQTLAGLTSSLGTITATDTILTAFNKLASLNNMTVATTAVSSAISVGQTITNVSVDGTTQTAPDATLMVIGQPYGVYNNGVAITTIVAAFSGQSIGGNASFTINGASNSCVFTSDGTNLQLM